MNTSLLVSGSCLGRKLQIEAQMSFPSSQCSVMNVKLLEQISTNCMYVRKLKHEEASYASLML